MKIVAIADLHGMLPDELPEGDVLIIAGDICPSLEIYRGEYGEDGVSVVAVKQARWLAEEFAQWLYRHRSKYREVIAIGGNGDFVLEYPELIPELPWTYLCDDSVVIDNLCFWGSPWVPIKWVGQMPPAGKRRPYWAFADHSEEEMRHHMNTWPGASTTGSSDTSSVTASATKADLFSM